MPWWAIVYLVVVAIVVVISTVKDYFDNRGYGYIIGEFVSGTLSFIFVVAYWQENLAGMIGWFVVPLLIYAIAWDQYALSRMQRSDYADLTEQENRDMDRYSKIFAVIFIAPCYIAGALLIYRLIEN
jgi:hypothetical protein